MTSINATDFKREFGHYSTAATKGEAITVTSHGKDRWVFLSIEEYERLQAERRSFAANEISEDMLEAMLSADLSHLERYNHEMKPD